AEIAKIAPPSALRVTDKMPANFRFAGLIHLALPNARMIHARRDPVETCLSCFSNSFAAGGLAWTCDLGELGRYCRGYLRLMEHWRTALPPGAMLEVDYEDVVDDLETQARRIVAYCGLPWDDRCLEFYKTERPVKTASVAQVRRPIYRTSLKTADAYGEAIRPLLDALGR
ncbi:MAG TPA: sulfotransferase, partial [Candidatus Baltobacteraceae bacterium]